MRTCTFLAKGGERMKTVALYTLGCKVAQYETEAIAEGFEALGFRVVPFESIFQATWRNTETKIKRKAIKVIYESPLINPARSIS